MKNEHKIIIYILTYTLVLCVSMFVYFGFNNWIEYKNKESKRAIMFKLSDSNYVCEDLINFAKDNL